MSETTTLATRHALVPLDWESDFFDLRAVQLTEPRADDAALAAALGAARRDGIRLVVWPAAADRRVADELLAEFQGTLVDRKVTFGRELHADSTSTDPADARRSAIVPFAAAAPSAELIELALAAGSHSRFRVDRRIPTERFEAMYARWIEGSVQGELADAVLVATAGDQQSDTEHRLAGMITLRGSDGVGSIGLVAVAEGCRGQGFGKRLLGAAHRWMRDRGATRATVVTQLANEPACRLYARCGYQQTIVQHYYHFWPQAEATHR